MLILVIEVLVENYYVALTFYCTASIRQESSAIIATNKGKVASVNAKASRKLLILALTSQPLVCLKIHKHVPVIYGEHDYFACRYTNMYL